MNINQRPPIDEMTAEEQSAIREFLQDEAQQRNEIVRNNKERQQRNAQNKEAAVQKGRKQNSKSASVNTGDKRLAAAVKGGKLLDDSYMTAVDEYGNEIIVPTRAVTDIDDARCNYR